MKTRVSYEKEMRDRAAQSHKGLFTLDLINGSKRVGKLGSRTTIQGPIEADEFKMLSAFMLKLIKFRQAKRKPAGTDTEKGK